MSECKVISQDILRTENRLNAIRGTTLDIVLGARKKNCCIVLAVRKLIEL